MFRRDRFSVRLPALSTSHVPRLATDEDGMISLASVLTVLFFLVLLAMVGNIGQAINRKIEAQNIADATATSAALQIARGLNAVTAANHLLGELLSLVVLHEAIGGKTPKQGQARDTQSLDVALQNSKADKVDGHDDIQRLAQYFDAKTPAFVQVSKKVSSDNMLFDSYSDLKSNLTKVYGVKIFALGLYFAGTKTPPPVDAILIGVGTVVYEFGNLCETYINAEWQVLSILEDFASGTVAARDALFSLLPYIRPFTLRVRDAMPYLAAQTAKAIGPKNGATSAIYPARPIMPLADDPTQPTDANFAHSQLVRATYPWVVYQRQPILDFMNWMVFSRARKHYREWTDRVTLSKGQELYANGGAPLLMLIDSGPEVKGHESWVNDSRQADRLFTLMGFAHKQISVGWGTSFFPQTNPGGIATFSQAIVYNANSNTGRTDPGKQPEAGWDTLNWQSGPGSNGAVEYAVDPKVSNPGPPRVRLNWQVKLIPVSRLAEASNRLQSPFRQPLQQIDPNSPSTHTH